MFQDLRWWLLVIFTCTFSVPIEAVLSSFVAECVICYFLVKLLSLKLKTKCIETMLWKAIKL